MGRDIHFQTSCHSFLLCFALCVSIFPRVTKHMGIRRLYIYIYIYIILYALCYFLTHLPQAGYSISLIFSDRGVVQMFFEVTSFLRLRKFILRLDTA